MESLHETQIPGLHRLTTQRWLDYPELTTLTAQRTRQEENTLRCSDQLTRGRTPAAQFCRLVADRQKNQRLEGRHDVMAGQFLCPRQSG